MILPAWYGAVSQAPVEIPADSLPPEIILDSLTFEETEDWFDAAWSHRNKITIDNTKVEGALSEFPVYVDLSHLGFDFFENVRSDGGDIRVTAGDGETELPREVVAIDTGTETGELHFLAPSLSDAADTEFYIYYGNAAASEPGGSAAWPSGYQLVWHMQETPNGADTIKDATGGGHHGTPSGDATEVDGQLGRAIETFDEAGGGGYVETPHANALDGGDTLVISAWFYPKEFGHEDFKSIVAKLRVGSSGHHEYALGWGDDGTIRFRIHVGGSNQNLITVATLPLNEWSLIHGVYDSAAGSERQRIYFNGAKVADANPSGTIDKLDNPFNAFHRDDVAVRQKNVIIDEVRKGNFIPSDDWIETEYANQDDPASFYTVAAQEATSTTTD